jgi:hypothetical protein
LGLLFPDDPGPEDLWSTGPPFAALPASGGICEHNSMGFFGVKKRYPYPLGQPSYRGTAILEHFLDSSNDTAAFQAPITPNYPWYTRANLILTLCHLKPHKPFFVTCCVSGRRSALLRDRRQVCAVIEIAKVTAISSDIDRDSISPPIQKGSESDGKLL